MSEAAENTVTLPIGAVEGKPDRVLVTQDNFQDYVTQEMRSTGEIPAESEDADANADPIKTAEKEAADLAAKQAEADATAAAPKEGDVDGSKVFFKGKWKDKSDFGYRLHLKETEAKAVAQKEIEAAQAKAKATEERADKAEKEAAELKAKYEPAPSTEPQPEPQPGDFTDVAAYSKALKEWVAAETRREDAAKSADAEAARGRESAAKLWNERKEAVAKEIPDYTQTIEASDVKLSDQASQAVMDSDFGHQILYHFAKNPGEAVALGKLTVGAMLKEIGRLEVKLGGTVKPATKSETAPEPKAAAEVSRAPAPITPLKGTNHGMGLKMDAAGNWTGTFEEFQAAKRAGKFK